MYLDYLQERYNATDFEPLTLPEIADKFEDIQRVNGNLIFKTDKSFVTYSLKGDALIIDDMYVKPEARKLNEAWNLWKSLYKLAQKYQKRVIITFSETLGKNRHMGLKVIKFAGFKPAYELNTGTMFIQGI